MQAVIHQHPRQVHEAVAVRREQVPGLAIAGPGQSLIETAQRLQGVAAYGDGGVADGIAGDELAYERLRTALPASGRRDGAVGVDGAVVAPHQRGIGVGVEGLHGSRQTPGTIAVIGIQKRDQRTLCRGQPGVARPGLAAAAVLQQPDAAAVATQQVQRTVGGAVVDDDQFLGGVVLRQHTVHALPQVARVVETGHDDADQGLRHGAMRSGSSSPENPATTPSTPG